MERKLPKIDKSELARTGFKLFKNEHNKGLSKFQIIYIISTLTIIFISLVQLFI